ncbi:MAG: nitrite/sulfite reductase [Candidatus Omnitrophica bacterium]|nr:nitrite/sulfite reductase [Candidatus Omnitrophota bacterium]
MKKPFTPNLKTQPADFSLEEKNKLASNGMRGTLREEFNDFAKPDISWEAEQLAKSCGVYLEFNRAITGTEKEWMYLIRVGIPGGGPINRKQWQLFDELSEKYAIDPQGNTSLRLTTRQNIQFHWVKKPGVLDIIKTLAENDLKSINGCGDNTRNVMACPLGQHSDIFNATKWSQKVADYFQLPLEPFMEVFAIDPKHMRQPEESFAYGKNLLNRKFKIGFSAVHKDPQSGKFIADNCVELLTNDMAVAPIVENGKVTKFQIYVGGGQGERNGKPSLATLAQPLAIVTEAQLLKTLDAVVKVHQEWGDRQNRVWARVKFVIKKMGIEWYRQQVQKLLDFPLGVANPNYDYGPRHLHYGWHTQPDNGLLTYGAFIETGRITDNSINGKLKTMVRDVMNKYPIELMITPNQDLLFTNIPVASREEFEADLKKYQYGERNGKAYSKLRTLSGACVGRDTCRLTYTDSERFEPELIDELEKMGWADMAESIGVTGCERQCFRPGTKTIGLVGSGLDRYMFKLFGDETAKFQGQPLITSDGEQMYLRSIPRENVAIIIDALFKFYKVNAKSSEGMGEFHRRIGADAIISHLKANPATAASMEKPFNTDCVMV